LTIAMVSLQPAVEQHLPRTTAQADEAASAEAMLRMNGEPLWFQPEKK
jgi:hypothetical protein